MQINRTRNIQTSEFNKEAALQEVRFINTFSELRQLLDITSEPVPENMTPYQEMQVIRDIELMRKLNELEKEFFTRRESMFN